MDPNEVIKHASELVKGGAEIVGALKLSDLAKAFLGPATAEFAERVRDEVRLYRFGRQLACLQKAEKMATEAGFTPKAVPIKLLFPLLEGASVEEDEDLHDMWAALLANAASPIANAPVRPSFIATLKQMAPDEANLLAWIYDKSVEKTPEGPDHGVNVIIRESVDIEEFLLERNTDIDSVPFGSCLNGLQAACLVGPSTPTMVPLHDANYSLTYRGFEFIEACRPPKPKS